MRAVQSRGAFNEIHIGFRWDWFLGDSDFDQPSSSLVANVSLHSFIKELEGSEFQNTGRICAQRRKTEKGLVKVALE